MGLMDTIRRRFTGRGIDPSGAAIITTTYGMNGNESILPYITKNNMQAYKSNPIVFGAILARISLFSECSFVFQDLATKQMDGAFTKDGRSNTSLRKLETPWPGGTTGDLLARMLQDADIAGNSYTWDTGIQLVRLRPEWVTIISALEYDALGREFKIPVGYYYEPPVGVRDFEGPPRIFDVDEIVHWAPHPDPEAHWRGMSWMTPVAREIAADLGLTLYKIQYLENAATPNIIIKYSSRLGDTTVNRIRERMEARHTGTENAFRTLVLDEGADITVVGNTFEQMNLSTVQAAGENRILIASGVPGIVVGSKEGLMAATYSNYEQAMRRFADITMRPLWRSACAALAKFVNVPSGKRLWYDTTDIAALRQGEKEMADTTFVQAQAVAALMAAKGFKPDSIVDAVKSGDVTQLVVDTEAIAATKAPPPTPFGSAPPDSSTPVPPVVANAQTGEGNA